MKITIRVIKADIGSIGGHIRPSQRPVETVREHVAKEAKGRILDSYVGHTGDDIAIVITHRGAPGAFLRCAAREAMTTVTSARAATAILVSCPEAAKERSHDQALASGGRLGLLASRRAAHHRACEALPRHRDPSALRL